MGIQKYIKVKKIAEGISSANNIYYKISGEVDLPFRFVTTTINSPTCKISEIIDILLKPFLTVIPSYIRDSTDFLIKKPAIINNQADCDDSIFVTCDVSDMYPNIILEEFGLEGVEYWLDTHPQLLHGRFNKKFILEGLTLVMTSCSFTFNDEHYMLKTGTATGTMVAPTYANLVMAFLETKMYNLVLEQFCPIVHTCVVKKLDALSR